MYLATELRLRRLRRGVTLIQLSKATGVPTTALSLLETGQVEAKEEHLRRLANFYGVRAEELQEELGEREAHHGP